MESVFILFIFVAVIVITAVLFSGWFVFSAVRLMFRGIAALASPCPAGAGRVSMAGSIQLGLRCMNVRCRHVNPAVAQFCRRCGSPLPIARQPVRRVAIL